MTRATVVRVVIVALFVVSQAGWFQWSARTEQRVDELEGALRVQARESSCAQVAASETLIRVAAESPPGFVTAHDRLLLTRFVQDAGRELQWTVQSCPS